MNSPCCGAYTGFEVGRYRFKHFTEGYDSSFGIYACSRCHRKWAIERIVGEIKE